MTSLILGNIDFRKFKNRLPVGKRFRFIESKQPIRHNDGTEAYENRTNSSWHDCGAPPNLPKGEEFGYIFDQIRNAFKVADPILPLRGS